MTYDSVTIATFAMFSLLSGSVACTMPTEAEEVLKRYNDMLAMLSEDEKAVPVETSESWFPQYPEDKWPWAMSESEYYEFLRQKIVSGLDSDYSNKELCIATMTALLANEKIEEKYRLSRVKPKLINQQLLPF